MIVMLSKHHHFFFCGIFAFMGFITNQLLESCAPVCTMSSESNYFLISLLRMGVLCFKEVCLGQRRYSLELIVKM
jgi:hypothetical protein